MPPYKAGCQAQPQILFSVDTALPANVTCEDFLFTGRVDARLELRSDRQAWQRSLIQHLLFIIKNCSCFSFIEADPNGQIYSLS